MVITPITGEPWVHLDDGAALSGWGREQEIAYNQQNRQAEKALFFQRTFDFLTDNRIRGDYLEFGCHRARTFRMALTEARKHNLDEMLFWAFDSFEGLPALEHESAVEHWQAGALKTDAREFGDMITRHGIYVDRCHAIKGFYADTLPNRRHDGAKAALITVDCDLYESAIPVFDFIDGLLQEGTVVYLDDLFAGFKGNPAKGVARAWLEYQRRSAWRFVRHLDVGWGGRSYIACPPSPLLAQDRDTL